MSVYAFDVKDLPVCFTVKWRPSVLSRQLMKVVSKWFVVRKKYIKPFLRKFIIFHFDTNPNWTPGQRSEILAKNRIFWPWPQIFLTRSHFRFSMCLKRQNKAIKKQIKILFYWNRSHIYAYSNWIKQPPTIYKWTIFIYFKNLYAQKFRRILNLFFLVLTNGSLQIVFHCPMRFTSNVMRMSVADFRSKSHRNMILHSLYNSTCNNTYPMYVDVLIK